MNRVERREGLRQLAERLTAECAGLVPPGQVIALVFRTHHALASSFLDEEEFCLGTCEAAARSALRRRTTATLGAAPRPPVRCRGGPVRAEAQAVRVVRTVGGHGPAGPGSRRSA